MKKTTGKLKKTEKPILQTVIHSNKERSKGGRPRKDGSIGDWVAPVLVSDEKQVSIASKLSALASTDYRRNRSSTIRRSDKYKNISDFVDPLVGDNKLNISDTIFLCRKAYFGFSLLRNVIDVMTELANSDLLVVDGNSTSRTFIRKWLKRIGAWALKEMFFREFWRSGNVFYYRFDANFSENDLSNLRKFSSVSARTTIPVKYLLLDPCAIKVGGDLLFQNPTYYQTLDKYILDRLKKPQTESEKAMVESLTEEEKKALQKGGSADIQLNPDRLYTIFYKKQDYEPFAIPMAFPVLEDINAKLELKKIDMAIARTTDWSILLITCGAPPDQGGMNYNTLTALQELMKNESVKRTLISDYTTKAEWLIPDINKILGKAKYEQINEDIAVGLNTILFDKGEKFANQSIKVQIFVERLKEARSAFLELFLQPEVDRICKTMGFKSTPTLKFEDILLKDELQFARVYTQLAQLGLMTAEETFEAMDTGKLPTPESSIESQKKFNKLKEEGLYQPQIGGTKQDNGRPSGTTNTPQSTKNVKPIGAGFSMQKISDNFKEFNRIEGLMSEKLCKRFKLKKLDTTQKEVCEDLVAALMVNEIKNIDKKVTEYSRGKIGIQDNKKAMEIATLTEDYQIGKTLATILYLSKT